MQKSIEERLVDIDGGITRLNKMHRCVFDMLLLLWKARVFTQRPDQALASIERAQESSRRHEDRAIVFIFGGIAFLSLNISMDLQSSNIQHPVIEAVSLVVPFMALILLLYGLWELFRTWRQSRAARQELAQIGEIVERAKRDEKAINDTLARVLAEWKELAPDDSLDKLKSDD